MPSSLSRSYLENQMAVALGGRVAEEIIYGPDNVTTGASGDFQQVRVTGSFLCLVSERASGVIPGGALGSESHSSLVFCQLAGSPVSNSASLCMMISQMGFSKKLGQVSTLVFLLALRSLGCCLLELVVGLALWVRLCWSLLVASLASLVCHQSPSSLPAICPWLNSWLLLLLACDCRWRGAAQAALPS